MMMKNCNNCKEQNITLNNMSNYTFQELEQAHKMMDRPSYTKDEIAWFYNLYNRVFKSNKQPGCGKCFMNIRRQIESRYKAENDGR